MNKLYSRIVWENFPSEKTALNESNLNRMDLGLDNLDNRVIEMDATKVNVEVANTLIKNWTIDEATGVITVEKLNGEKILFDLNIEKIPVNFELSEDGILTMTTDDGTQYTANIGAMIPVLTFNDSDTIAVSVTGTGVNKTYSFSIKAGSVTEDKLQPNFLADVKTEVAKAKASQESAAQSASDASSAASTAAISESNAKTSETAAFESASAAKESETNAEKSATNAASSAQSASDSAGNALTYANSANESAGTASAKATEASESATSAFDSATSASISAASAGDSATAASDSAILAESYTHGGTGSRTGEETDNAKYYYEKAKNTEIGKVSEEVAGLNNDIGVLSARLDNIASLPEGSTTADAELMDIRVGSDGRTHNTAGEAVREQVGELKSDLSTKINKNMNVNLNNDPLFTNIIIGVPAFPSYNWGFSVEPNSYSVSNGKLIYNPLARSDKLRKAIKVVKNHEYYMYIPVISSSADFVMDCGGEFGLNKGKSNFIENTFTWDQVFEDAYVQLYGAGGYDYTIGTLVVIDMTENNLSLEDARKIRNYILKNPTEDIDYFLKSLAIEESNKPITTIINVKNYGAVGDGIKDDTSAIASAVSNCPYNGTVYFPMGTYIVQDILCKSNITVLGEGAGTIIKLKDNMTTPNQNCISINSVSNVTIKNIALDGNRTNNKSIANNADGGWNGIHINGSTDILVENVISHSNGYHGCIIVNASNIEIRNSKFYDNGYRPIHGHSTVYNVKIHNCECYENGNGFEGETGGGSSLGNGLDAVFFFDDVKKLSIEKCYIHDPHSMACIQVGGNLSGNGLPSNDIVIQNNRLESENSGVYGVQVMGCGISDVLIENNTIKCQDGVMLKSDLDGDNYGISIVGNSFIGCIDFGVRFAKAYRDCLISNNMMISGNQFGIYIIDGTRMIINGNSISDFQFGIRCNGCTDILVSGNKCVEVTESKCVYSFYADDSNNNIRVCYNLFNKIVDNNSIDGLTIN